MASAATGEPSVPPLIADQIGRAARIVVVATALGAARTWASDMAAEAGIDAIVTASRNGVPLVESRPDDVLVHGVPDVFGRLLAIPSAWSTVVIRDRIAASSFPVSGPLIEVGPAPDHDPNLIAGALRAIFKPICQQRRVRPVFGSPPPFGLPFIAPTGVHLPGSFGVAVPEDLAGLPDLVVVRPSGAPPPGTSPVSVRAMMQQTSDDEEPQ
ncbi:MAG: hypothetical protein WD532_08980 [Acidimicrobiia bacterium]